MIVEVSNIGERSYECGPCKTRHGEKSDYQNFLFHYSAGINHQTAIEPVTCNDCGAECGKPFCDDCIETRR